MIVFPETWLNQMKNWAWAEVNKLFVEFTFESVDDSFDYPLEV